MYEFKNVYNTSAIYFDEAKILPGKGISVLSMANHHHNLYELQGCLKYSDLNNNTLGATNLQKGELFHDNFYCHDFDYDGFDEIIVLILNNYRIKIGYLDLSGSTQEIKIIGTLPSDKKIFEGETNISHFQYDADQTDEVLISIATNYPQKNAYRGVFAFDIETQQQLWFYPTAYWIRSIKCYDHDGKNTRIICNTAGVNNGMAYHDSIYFDWNKQLKKYLPDTSISQKSNFVGYDQDANNFSNDSSAALFALNKDGKISWKHDFGGPYLWSRQGYLDDATLLFHNDDRRSKKDKQEVVYKIDPVSGKILNKKSFENIKYARAIDNKIYITNNNQELLIFDNNFNLQERKKFSDQLGTIHTPFKYQNEIFYPISIYPGSLYFLNENLKIIGSADKSGDVTFYTGRKIIGARTHQGYHFYQIRKRNFSERFSSKALTLFIFFLFILSTIILILWLFTMRISKQKILAQKEEIEENHKKLEEATSLIVHNEKMAVLGTIGASLAHELNSPLTAIYNSAERLKELPHIGKNGNIDLILRSGKRCINIIDKFLRPVRNISNQKTANPKDILEDWLDIYENDFHNYFIGLSLDVIDDIHLKITYEELYQVLTNLLLNARDELNQNENINKNIIIRLYKRNNNGVIEIQDNGGGIDEETLKNIFKPLNTTKELGKGIGIGLWLTKQLIEKNNGNIEISTSSRGTLIEIELELAKIR